MYLKSPNFFTGVCPDFSQVGNVYATWIMCSATKSKQSVCKLAKLDSGFHKFKAIRFEYKTYDQSTDYFC